MKKVIYILVFSTTVIIAISVSCKSEPFFPDFEHAGGYVIGKEFCKANADEDYWLVDLSFPLNTVTNYGDTITINGTLYKNMIKTKQLPSTFKEIGRKVSFDFHLSADKVESTGCAFSNAITYKLKNMEVLASFEIR